MTEITTPRPPLTVRTPVSEHPTVAVYPDVRDPGFVVLEWRVAESVHREVLHRADLIAALGAGRQPAPTVSGPSDYEEAAVRLSLILADVERLADEATDDTGRGAVNVRDLRRVLYDAPAPVVSAELVDVLALTLRQQVDKGTPFQTTIRMWLQSAGIEVTP